MAAKSQQEILGAPARSQKDIFASTNTKPRGDGMGRYFKHFNRNKGPRTLNITTRTTACGETTTNLSGYRCPRKHFAGWWGQWKELEPCECKK